MTGEACKMRQRGAMYEINLIVWPALYGYAGWLWGAAYGWPVAGTLLALAAGVPVGVLTMTVNPYGAALLAVPAALLLPWWLDAETWRWVALALCAAPLPTVVLGLLLGRRWM
jgi:hypothetical protein